MSRSRLRSFAVLLVLPLLLGVAPTVAQEATPAAMSAEITTEALATIPLPAAAIPSPPAIVDVWVWSLSPNQELRFGTGQSPPSIAADVVLNGEYSVNSEGRLQVQRATGLEEVPSGSAVTVRPGDVVIYVDNQAAQTLRNTGDDWARAISVGVFSTAPPSPLVVGAVSSEDWERSGLVGHDLLVTVERLTLAPGASLRAFTPDVRAPRVFAVIEGVAHQARVSAGAATPSRPVSFYKNWAIWFTPLGAGEQLQLSNAQDRPLVLLQVTLSADDEATPVAAAPMS